MGRGLAPPSCWTCSAHFFEAAASRPPQDEDSSLMPSITYLMLRSARRARLEARTALLQLFFFSATRFPDSLEGRDLSHRWALAFAGVTIKIKHVDFGKVRSPDALQVAEP